MTLSQAPQLADVVGWKPHRWSEEEYALVTGEQTVDRQGKTRTFTLRPLVVVSDEREFEFGKLTLRPTLYASNAYYVEEWKLRALAPDEYVIQRDGRAAVPAIIAGTVCLEWKKEGVA